MLDQGLFAISNFALGVLLARWLAPEEFGAFAVAYSVFLLVGTAHSALLTEPMLVFGPGKFQGTFVDYLGVLLRAHWVVAVAGSFLLATGAMGAWLMDSVHLGQALIGVAIAAPFILLSWLARRACFAVLQPHHAAAGGAVYLVLMLTGSYLVYRIGELSTVSALLVIAASSLVAAFWIIGRLRKQRLSDFEERREAREVVHEHWAYGRWALPSSLISWVPGNIYFLILPMAGGLEAAAALKAMMNLVMPIMHANTALATLLVPALVVAPGWRAFRKIVTLGAGLLLVTTCLYWIVLALFSKSVIGWLYAGRYVEYAHLFWALGAVPVLACAVNVLASALRALERPKLVFHAYAVAAATSLTFGIGAVVYAGIAGVIVALLLSYCATGLLLLWKLTTLDEEARLGLMSRQSNIRQGSADALAG